MGPTKARSLIAFHAFTGCDQTSSFAGRGKKVAWTTWKVYDKITPAFFTLSSMPTEDILKEHMPTIERCVVLMYDRTSFCLTVNEAHKDLFTRKGQSIENIPPSYGALVEHTKRIAYQAGHCWGQSLTPEPILPSPSKWGWTRSDNELWQPYWTMLPEASKAIEQLIKGGCKLTNGCRGHCKCLKADLKCTSLCSEDSIRRDV